MTVATPEKPRSAAPATHPAEQPSQHKYRFRSKFLLAAAIFTALNMCLTFFTPFPFDPYKFNYRGWAWWTFNELRHTSKVSNIALLGSSTMVSALAGTDANYLNANLDLTNHHSSSYLEGSLKRAFNKGDFATFSLAAPGQMPSDAYITLKGMVASASRPDIVIYGVAPRDFIDSTLTAPGDTDAFKYITRFVNIDDVAQRVFRSPWSKLDWLFQRNIYLYCYSLDIRIVCEEFGTRALATILPRPWTKTPFSWWDRRNLLPGYLPAEVHPDALMAGPIDRKTAEAKYSDNTLEYMQRYKNPDIHTYRTQMYFLTKIADFCRKERIELVIVNMPVTLDNLRLLKPGGYMGYLQGLREFAIINKLSVYDLNDFGQFNRKDFHDTVHLNAFGGQKFLDNLTATLSADVRLKEILSMSGEHLAKHKEIAARPTVPTF
jgi:hypothetical protein